jgi:hypothetical protein
MRATLTLAGVAVVLVLVLVLLLREVGRPDERVSRGPSVSALPTFASETAYLSAPEPSLTHAIHVASANAFERAVADAAPGQVIDVAGDVRIPGEFTGFDRVIHGGTVDVVFEPGATFTGVPGQNLAAVWLKNSGGWRIWGGMITTESTGGYGLLVHAMPGPVTWTGFTVRYTGNTGVAVYPVGGDIERLTLKGLVTEAGLHLGYDPHAEKGTGIHAWNIADGPPGHVVEHSTFAADIKDQPTGAGVSVGMGDIGPGDVLYARAVHLGFALRGTTWRGEARDQVAGNVVQLWGPTPPEGGRLDIRYVVGDRIQGRIVETAGAYSGASYALSSVDYGRSTGPILQNKRLSRVAYNVGNTGLKLGKVAPHT